MKSLLCSKYVLVFKKLSFTLDLSRLIDIVWASNVTKPQ